MITVLVFTLALCSASAACTNECSGHGTCGSEDICTCFPRWTDPDCSMRECPYGPSWVADQSPGKHIGPATGDLGGRHGYTVCSSKGSCSRESGECECFPGYTGLACSRQNCPEDCSGHGLCITNKQADSKYSYENAFVSQFWDAAMARMCACDRGWEGYACAHRICPSGADPLTCRKQGKNPSVQRITLKNMDFPFHEDDLFKVAISLTFTDMFNGRYSTQPIRLKGKSRGLADSGTYNGKTITIRPCAGLASAGNFGACSQSGAWTALNQYDNVDGKPYEAGQSVEANTVQGALRLEDFDANRIRYALQSLPNFAVPSVNVTDAYPIDGDSTNVADIRYNSRWYFDVTFTDVATSGEQALMECTIASPATDNAASAPRMSAPTIWEHTKSTGDCLECKTGSDDQEFVVNALSAASAAVVAAATPPTPTPTPAPPGFSLVSAGSSTGKYNGAVALGTKVYFAPFNSDDVGVVDTTDNTFSTISTDIVGGETDNQKYNGAAAVGTTVYFAPYSAETVGVLDTASNAFSVISTGAMAQNAKYKGAAAVGTKVYFAMHNTDSIGVVDTTDNTFTTLPAVAAGTDADKYGGAVAVGTSVYFAPYNNDDVGILNTIDNAFTVVSTTDAGVTGDYKYDGAAAVGTKVYFTPFAELNVGVYDTVSGVFSTIALSAGVTGGFKYIGAVAVGTSVYFAPYTQPNIGVLDTLNDEFSTVAASGVGTGGQNNAFQGAAAVGNTAYFAPYNIDSFGMLTVASAGTSGGGAGACSTATTIGLCDGGCEWIVDVAEANGNGGTCETRLQKCLRNDGFGNYGCDGAPQGVATTVKAGATDCAPANEATFLATVPEGCPTARANLIQGGAIAVGKDDEGVWAASFKRFHTNMEFQPACTGGNSANQKCQGLLFAACDGQCHWDSLGNACGKEWDISTGAFKVTSSVQDEWKRADGSACTNIATPTANTWSQCDGTCVWREGRVLVQDSQMNVNAWWSSPIELKPAMEAGVDTTCGAHTTKEACAPATCFWIVKNAAGWTAGSATENDIRTGRSSGVCVGKYDAGVPRTIAANPGFVLHQRDAPSCTVSRVAVPNPASTHICSNRGLCDKGTGLCNCFEGYAGEDCSRQNIYF